MTVDDSSANTDSVHINSVATKTKQQQKNLTLVSTVTVTAAIRMPTSYSSVYTFKMLTITMLYSFSSLQVSTTNTKRFPNSLCFLSDSVMASVMVFNLSLCVGI